MSIKRLLSVLVVTSVLLIPLSSYAVYTDEKKLSADDGAASDYFGRAVAIRDDIAIVGAQRDESNAGSAYVFLRDPNTQDWTFHQKLTAATSRQTGYFGNSIAISGDTAIIGSYGVGNGRGFAYVFVRDPSTNDWSEVQTLFPPYSIENPTPAFGWSVGISGNTIIVGAWADTEQGSNAGAAYVYTFNTNNNTWELQQKLLANDGSPNDFFGRGVAIDGDLAIVGADGAPNDGSSGGGAAYVFKRTGNIWSLDGKLYSTTTYSRYGSSVTINGTRAVVGAYEYNNRGAAFVFERNSSNNLWVQQATLQRSDDIAFTDFGYSVSLDGNILAVGAPYDGQNTTDPGAAFIYTLDYPSGNWVEQKLLASDPLSINNYGRYGWSVSIKNGSVIIGAPNATGISNYTGATYVYTGPGPDPEPDVPDIDIDKSNIDFGEVTLQTSSDQTITVSNLGTQDLSIGNIGSTDSLAPPFNILNDICSGQSLTPSSNCTFDIRFVPTTVGAFNDSVNIPSDDPVQNTITINVSGTGAAIPVPDIVVTDTVPPDNDLQILFGDVTTGTSSVQTATITNNGNADLILGDLGTANPLATPFSLENDTCTGQTLTPASSCTFDIRFAPISVNPFSDSLDIPSNDPDEDPVTFSVSGTGLSSTVPDITVTDAVAPNNDLQVPFGSFTIGASTNQTLTITNSGNGDLVLGAIATANPLVAPFSIQNNFCDGQTLAPASSCDFDVRFAPTAEGVFNESLDIPSNDPDEDPVTISVSGTGTAIPVPDITVTDTMVPLDDLQVPFGDVTEGLSTYQTVTLSNDGNADLVIGDIAGANPVADPFAIFNDTCSGQTLLPTTDCTFDVSFTPIDTSTSNDSFDVPSNDPDEGSLTINLSGTGLSSVTNNSPGKPRLVFPANGQEQVETNVTFRWRPVSDPDGDLVSYDVFYCTDADPFQSCEAVQVTSFNGQNIGGRPNGNIYYAGIGSGVVMLFFGVSFARRLRGRKKIALLIAMTIAIGGLLMACGSSSNSNDETFAVEGLDSGTQYYWGVVAKDGQGGQTQSDVWSFTTR